jgi:hypothetical protein
MVFPKFKVLDLEEKTNYKFYKIIARCQQRRIHETEVKGGGGSEGNCSSVLHTALSALMVKQPPDRSETCRIATTHRVVFKVKD